MDPLSGRGLRAGLPARLRWTFAIASAALAASALWAAVAEHRAEWRVAQRRGHAAGAHAEAPGLRQIWLPDLDRVDRCPSCHVAIAETTSVGAVEARALPYRGHPGRWLETHRLERHGCTVCHGGQGEATTFRGAGHRGRLPALEPMASRELMEAHCGTCHRERKPAGMPWLARGRALMADRNCVGCHELPGFDVREVRAPRLDGLPHKVSAGWLRAWLARPGGWLPKTRMGDFRLSADDVEALVAFLLLRNAEPAAGPAGGDAERGGQTLRRSRCVTCHEIEGRGGSLAPALTHVGAKASRTWLAAWLRDPHVWQPETLMPRFHLADDDVRDLATHLASDLGEAPEGMTLRASAVETSRADGGRRLFERRGCYSCHQLEGVPKLARIGPKLAGVGDRVLEPAPLLARGVRATLPNWIFVKLRAPEQVLESARMPTFGFSEADAAALAVALGAFRARETPPSRVRQDPGRRAYEPQGGFGALVRRYRCLSCHEVEGSGGTLSTVALDRIGSQLRRDHIVRFLRSPYAIRVGQQERMPQLGITAGEAGALADHLSRVMVADAFAAPVLSDAGAAARGRDAFARNGCIACHIAGDTGGYIGPELNGSGSRLAPGWIVEWLRAPQRWKPGTLEPDLGLARSEAEDLAAYVSRLPARQPGRRR